MTALSGVKRTMVDLIFSGGVVVLEDEKFAIESVRKLINHHELFMALFGL